MVKKYLDINGVEIVFEVMKEKLDLTKEELFNELKKNATSYYTKNEVDEKVSDLLEKIKENRALLDNYYTKYEIDGMLPNEIAVEDIIDAYNNE